MTGFLDIAERTKQLDIGGQKISVHELPLSDIADLALRFEPFRKLIQRQAFGVEELVKCGRPFLGAIIAAAVGKGGDAEHEAKAAKLGAGSQLLILTTLYEASFPEDVRGPFAEALKRLFGIELNLVAASLPDSSAAS